MPSNILPHRYFGVEIELKGLTEGQACETLRSVGISAQCEGYSHRATAHWKIVYDGSLEGTSCEVVSPKLLGQEGLDELVKVVNALAAAGASVDRQCGLHVHVDAERLTTAEIAGVVRRYAENESTIDSWMPQSRRGDSNRFCRAASTIDSRIGNLPVNTHVNDLLSAAAANDYDDSRYYKLNVQAWSRHKTIEFRQHSGSCNADKIVNWVKFVLHFVEATRQHVQNWVSTLSTEAIVRPIETNSGHNGRRGRRNPAVTSGRTVRLKLQRLVEGLETNGRLSNRAIADLLGISEASVPVYVSKARLELGCYIARNRTSHLYVWGGFGVLGRHPAAALDGTEITLSRAARRTEAAITIREMPHQNENIFDGIPLEVANFYRERAEDLANAR